ncbi:uncharacterized protein LOC143676750 [Tamandua tetradactyla]|uniref:uncharacterized protein LOC143676750 n=1 Tax=Tamandua tetradactyla TaxID=48850 RepID=UPI004053D907
MLERAWQRPGGPGSRARPSPHRPAAAALPIREGWVGTRETETAFPAGGCGLRTGAGRGARGVPAPPPPRSPAPGPPRSVSPPGAWPVLSSDSYCSGAGRGGLAGSRMRRTACGVGPPSVEGQTSLPCSCAARLPSQRLSRGSALGQARVVPAWAKSAAPAALLPRLPVMATPSAHGPPSRPSVRAHCLLEGIEKFWPTRPIHTARLRW